MLWLVWLLSLSAGLGTAKVLTPPYINIAENSKVDATYTCGEGIEGTELYCKLVGANQEGNEEDTHITVIQGQVCDICNASDPAKYHPPSAAVDGTESYWMSPPLSRGMEYSQVNFNIDLGQEFHVAYVIIKMGISPRPGVWVLEKSSDNGKTYTPWQYFADTQADCERFFGPESLEPITRDDSVICDTRYSKIIPLEDGEIVVSLLNDRPSAHDFFNSSVLQEWTRATNVRLRLIQTRTLYAHLMSISRQDPSVTRRYFYSIRDISIGGRCRCNGHADVCLPVEGSFTRACDCKHNTTGINCEKCKENLVQKKWQQSRSNKVFECEECNCHGHSNECVYNETVDALGLSLDKYGNYEGGGVCQNCQDNTEGINCEKCIAGYYRPFGRKPTQKDACQRCNCEGPYYTGNCADLTGVCECKVNFEPPLCDKCAYGFFAFPTCKNCTCYINGTVGGVCEPSSQVSNCTCLPNFDGADCKSCNKGYYNFPECKRCDCHPLGSPDENEICDIETGQCDCRDNYGGLKCNQCANGFYDFPQCTFCKCDPLGTVDEVCDKQTGQCLCKEGFGGSRCDKCIPGYKDYPDCQPCGCSDIGSTSKVCEMTGKCSCLDRFSGKTCSQCAFGYYKYPECLPCNCETQGTVLNAQSCDDNAQCKCRDGIVGKRCEMCREGLFNFPTCEECNCNPAGVLRNSSDCGELSKVGELCQCKPMVIGRTCNQCKPLFWNLKDYNPNGCEECACNAFGVVGGIAVCDTVNGQCQCKQNVEMRQCDTCVDGTYNLEESNIFGCTDCSCDIGGALQNVCDKQTGACSCRPRITGRACNEPMMQHYFPTLHQFKYELEDGTTPDYRPLSYGYEDSVFPNYSWRGYAIFTHVQNTVRKQVELNSDNFHYIVMRYVNRNDETIPGTILARHEEEEPIELKISFKPAIQPSFAFAAGAGNIPLPLIAVPQGTWDIEITVNQSLFIDYFVLIPQSYYEGNILIDAIREPCKRGEHKDCKHYAYPNIDTFDVVYGDSAFTAADGAREDVTDFLEDWERPLGGSKIAQLPELSAASRELRFDLRVRRKDPAFMVIDYATPTASNATAIITVDIEGNIENYSTNIKLAPCPYTWLCRQAVLDHSGKIATFNIDEDFITAILLLENEASVGIESVGLVPYNPDTAHSFLKLSPVCITRDGKCRSSVFETPVDLKKVEFESGNEPRKATVLPPQIFDNNTVLIYLDKEDPMIDLAGKVPSPGNYTFIVHYYQPNHPDFNLSVVIHNGYSYEGILPLVHCPSSSGCRSVVRRNDGKGIALTENFLLTVKAPEDKNVWLDYVLVLPDVKFSPHLMTDKQEGSIDRFLKECSNNFFYADNSISEFCRSSIFSLTTHYNNGALKCECHPDGAYSLQCEPFGGQCKCRENIIGRRCERCKTGYYQFPYCKPCECHENSLCDESTGQCSCPPNVVGEYCDQCANNTYGYFPQLGCRECECNLFGLKDGNLQCDPTFGTCNCKDNVIGRQCDSCKAGYFSFPECLKCDCDLRGTISDICSNETGVCLCKENVEAEGCDICREGSFNIQANNRQGCTKCFCFEHSDRCTSSRLYKSVIANMANWNLSSITVKKPVIDIAPVNKPLELTDPDSLGIVLSEPDLQGKVIYFSAPGDYLGNRLTSYGGVLTYSLLATSEGDFIPTERAPDLVLVGGNFHLLYHSDEVPATQEPTPVAIELLESNFILSNNFLPASRAQLMQVLRDLKAIYIKATYWKQSSTTRLSRVHLDSASDEYSDRGQALSVEQCFCEPQYTGLSCEECAPGYYRSHIGPYGGNCVPCQCHGHAATCDKETGICIDCQHNTTGDHCEKCAVGYHGDARNGLPYDCIICACPLPIPGNNFANSCDFSQDGELISCNCKEGYFGSRCESCALGYYGTPESEGNGECKPCECSGNINPNVTGSCDSITGKCLKCLHNTFGEACSICEPFYFGDAVYAKNCQSCVCDKCGSERCDHETGICECRANVTGDRCDTCIPDHYGINSCSGCKPCECGIASEGSQCDVETGNCKCKPGVTGRTCDKCEHGYWNLNSDGCEKCSCNIGYSIGVGCDPLTGLCQCLPGVIGEKCDHCPHRWVLKPSQGCLECDKCIDDILDTMDSLHNRFGPFASDFTSFNESFFTRQRVIFINQTVNSLQPNVSALQNIDINFAPIRENLNSVVDDVDKLTRKVEYIVGKAHNSTDEELRNKAKETEDFVQKAIEQAKNSVMEVLAISESFKNGGGGANYGYSGPEYSDYLEEAKRILNELENMQLTHDEQQIRGRELAKAENLLQEVKKVKEPVDMHAAAIANITNRIDKLKERLDDFMKLSDESIKQSRILGEQTKKLRSLGVPEKFKTVTNLENVCYDTLKVTDGLLNETRDILDNVDHVILRQLSNNETDFEDLSETVSDKIRETRSEIANLRNIVDEAEIKGIELENQGKELKRLQNEFHHDSNSVQAYKNIIHTLRGALIVADEAKRLAENASESLDGKRDESIESKDKSTQLHNAALGTLKESQAGLEPQLDIADRKIEELDVKKDDMKADIDNFENLLEKALQTMNTAEKSGTAVAEEAAAGATEIQNSIKNIVEELPQKIVMAKQIRDNTKDGEAAINEASDKIDEVNNILPNMNELIHKLGERPKSIEKDGMSLKAKLEELRNQINKAREEANKIKVGITLYRNSTLELKNPPNLPEQEINNRISVYFNTKERNGLLFFLGNEAHSQLFKRSVKTGDFIALEIENGKPKLTVDLGSGATSLICDFDVDDENWYFAKVERTGKSLKLTVTRLNDKVSCVEEGVMKGNTAVLNLDKKTSKLFVGGLPPQFNGPSEITYNSFEGQLEELMIDNQLVGFWNFEESENVFPAQERDTKESAATPTGFRFNGDGFVVLNSVGWQFSTKSEIVFRFKTFAQEGLMFLASNGAHFISIELREGRVLFQFDLGSGPLKLSTPATFNDGEWHSIEATRYENKGSLKVDGDTIGTSESPGDNKKFDTPEKAFMGGFPGEHNIFEVGEIDFDGCIDGVQIDGQSVDLDKNLEAVGVIPSCPPKFSRIVSFEPGARGYVLYPNVSAHHNTMELILRFKTTSPDGLLAYADYDDYYASLSLSGGQILFKVAGKDMVKSESVNPYNDSAWHVVMATYDTESLQLFIDDYEKHRSDKPPAPIRMLHGNLYFGGVPSKVNAEAAISKHFSGCISDATLNGVIINFGNLTETPEAIIGKCIEGVRRQPLHKPPPLPPPIIPVEPKPAPTSAPEPESPETTPTPRVSRPDHVPECKVSLYPKASVQEMEFSAYKIGTSAGSRLEYTNQTKIRHRFDFSIDIKTGASDGLIFYASEQKQYVDFIAVYIHQGLVHFRFDCGSGPAHITSTERVDDKKWHTIRFQRQQNMGTLTVGSKSYEGSSQGQAKTMHVDPPYYIGGINPSPLFSSPNIQSKVTYHLQDIKNSLDGCVKDFKLNNYTAGKPSHRVEVTPCDTEYNEVYFSPEGGYVKLLEKFKIGKRFDFEMEVRPRALSGLLLSVHSRDAYFVLELDNGDVRMSVDVGHGNISTTIKRDKLLLCDGKWHTITGAKALNALTLGIDGYFPPVTIGESQRKKEYDTKHVLYLGGHPNLKNAKGLTSRLPYVGCMKNIKIRKTSETIDPKNIFGNVTGGICPD